MSYREPMFPRVGFTTSCAGNGAKSMVAGSGGGGLKASSASISLENEGSVQLRIGDDPAAPDGQIVTLRLDITSMHAWNSTTSDAIDFLVDPISVELTHSSTVTVPIAQSGANPNTTYDRLDIVYAGVGIAYVDYPSGTLYNQELGALPSQTVDLSSSPITLGSDPVIVDVNVNVPSMIVLPPVGNWSPRGPRSMTARPMASGATLGGNPLVTVSQSGTQSQSGQIQYLNGSVTKVVGNALTSKPTGNSSFTFQTGSNTDFENVTLGTALNAVVEVNGSTQADGSLFADEVELVDIANGTEMLGMVSSVAPDVQLSLVVQDGIGSGMSTALVGKTVNSQMDQASFTVSTGKIDMTGVTAVFDGEHIFPDQQVELESFQNLQADPEGSAGLTLPYMVELEQQTISGTARNYVADGVAGTGTFNVFLPTDGTSPLMTLNPGLVSVHVYQQTTTFPAISSIRDGRGVQVRGLLLCQNDNVGQPCTNFVMVAAKITVND